MCKNLSLFIEHKLLYCKRMQHGRGTLDAIAIGSIRLPLKTTKGKINQVLMTNILFVLELFTSLVSVRKLRQHGVYFHTGNDCIYRMSNSEELASTKLRLRQPLELQSEWSRLVHSMMYAKHANDLNHTSASIMNHRSLQ